MKKITIPPAIILLLMLCSIHASAVVEAETYRLLSVADTPKLILISQISSKTRYILDATSAKITVNGKPAEFKDLKSYVIIQVKMELHKFSKDGIEIDGTATEIRIKVPEDTAQAK